MKTIEFATIPDKKGKGYAVISSPELNGIKKMQGRSFPALLLETIVLLSKGNSARESVNICLPKNLPTRYQECARMIFMQYAGYEGVVVLYPNSEGKQEMLRSWDAK